MTDIFRKEYKALPPEKAAMILSIKEQAEELENRINATLIKSREMSLALTNLEQAMMWCTKAIVISESSEPEERTDIAVFDYVP